MTADTAQTPTNTKGFQKIVLLIILLIIFFLILTCFYQVRRKQAVVITTFEEPVATKTEPGLTFKLPWPIQKAYIFDLRSRIYQSVPSQYLLKDGNIIVNTFAFWSIKDASVYKNKVGVTVSDGENIIGKLLDKTLRSTLSNYPLDKLVTINNKTKSSQLSLVEQQILKEIQKEASTDYGIEISLVGFNRFELPEETTKFVFDRMKAERMEMVEKILSEGKYKANKIRKEAESEVSRLKAEAEADAIRIRGKANTEAFKHEAVYNKHPEFALFLKKLQALEKTVKSKTTIVIDKSTPPFDMLSTDSIKLREEKKAEKKRSK